MKIIDANTTEREETIFKIDMQIILLKAEKAKQKRLLKNYRDRAKEYNYVSK